MFDSTVDTLPSPVPLPDIEHFTRAVARERRICHWAAGGFIASLAIGYLLWWNQIPAWPAVVNMTITALVLAFTLDKLDQPIDADLLSTLRQLQGPHSRIPRIPGEPPISRDEAYLLWRLGGLEETERVEPAFENSSEGKPHV